jgi:4-hydroxybenzoate polyprenyltransferase
MLGKVRDYADFVKIEHTLFALPFAYIGAFLGAKGWFGFKTFVLIALAFTGMRTIAMTLNRIIDREIDALNPRTANRHLPSGKMTLREAYMILAFAFFVYFVSVYTINRTAFILSPIPIVTAYVYPYLKRFSPICHHFLGLNLAFAPLGGWVAVRDSVDFDPSVLSISVGVVLWVAGFDVIYAIQDLDFDRKMGLHSICADFGVKNALIFSNVNHIIFFFLIAFGLIHEFGLKASFGLIVISALLFYEHYIVRDINRLNEKKIQIAFFNINALISLTLFLTVLVCTFV